MRKRWRSSFKANVLAPLCLADFYLGVFNGGQHSFLKKNSRSSGAIISYGTLPEFQPKRTILPRGTSRSDPLPFCIPFRQKRHSFRIPFTEKGTSLTYLLNNTASLIASSLYFPTKVGSTAPNCQKLCIRLVVGTAGISTLEKQNVDCKTEKLKILNRSRVAVMLLRLQTTSRQLVTTSNGTTLIY